MVHIFASETEDFHAAHRGMEADQDEGVNLRVVVGLSALKEPLAFLHGQVVDPPALVLQKTDPACGVLTELIPFPDATIAKTRLSNKACKGVPEGNAGFV